MDPRERFRRYVRFQPVDRPPRWEWAFRADTTALWYAQGLPPAVPDTVSWARYWGLDSGFVFLQDPLPTKLDVDFLPLPSLACDEVEQTADYVVQRDRWGALSRSLRVGIRSIPQYASFAIRTREDWQRFRAYLDPLDPARYPSDWAARVAQWQARDYPLALHVHGWYGLLRELLGVENLSLAFHDQPALIEEICEFWVDFVVRLYERALAEVQPDYVLFWEDLAYKTGPLLSPQQFRRFFLAHYRRVIDHFRRRGIDTFMVDSDGNIDLITPLWLDAGITMLGPYEVAAGMDVVQVRRQYPDLVLIGGIDKREIARGPQAIETEVLRCVPPLWSVAGTSPRSTTPPSPRCLCRITAIIVRSWIMSARAEWFDVRTAFVVYWPQWAGRPVPFPARGLTES